MALGDRPRILMMAAMVSLLTIACTDMTRDQRLSPLDPSQGVPELTNPMGQAMDHLDMTLIPHANSEEQLTKLGFWTKYLEQELGIPVNITLAKNYDEAIALLAREEVAIAYLGAGSYIKAKQENNNLEPIVAAINRDTGRPWYRSVIVTTTDIAGIEGLRGKRFGFVSPSSTSGFLVPSYNLKKLGLAIDTDFKGINYAGSHDQNVENLIGGVVDAIAIDEDIYLRHREAGQLDPQRYHLIWESEPIPNPPIVVSTKLLSPESILALKKVLIAAPEGLVSVTGTDSIGYTIVEDQDYSTIRNIYLTLQ